MIKIHNQALSTLTSPLGEWIREQHMADVTLLNAVLPISQHTHLHGWQVQESALLLILSCVSTDSTGKSWLFQRKWLRRHVLHWEVVAFCTAAMLKSRVCSGLPSSIVRSPKLNSPSPAWSGVFAIPVMGSEIREKWRDRKMYCYWFCSLDRRAWGNNCWVWDKSSCNLSSVLPTAHPPLLCLSQGPSSLPEGISS